jgi:hypothetical protein
LKKLEETRAPPDLISVIDNTSEAAAEKQRREFLEKHGRPPTREIVIQFV